MELQQVICVICNQAFDDKTVKFIATTLDKNKSIFEIRKEHNIKFNDLSLRSYC